VKVQMLCEGGIVKVAMYWCRCCVKVEMWRCRRVLAGGRRKTVSMWMYKHVMRLIIQHTIQHFLCGHMRSETQHHVVLSAKLLEIPLSGFLAPAK